MALVRDGSESRLRELLADLADRVDVRELISAGPPWPLFQPHRSDVREVREGLIRGTKIRCELDARERTVHCHHEKPALVRAARAGGRGWRPGDRGG